MHYHTNTHTQTLILEPLCTAGRWRNRNELVAIHWSLAASKTSNGKCRECRRAPNGFSCSDNRNRFHSTGGGRGQGLNITSLSFHLFKNDQKDFNALLHDLLFSFTVQTPRLDPPLPPRKLLASKLCTAGAPGRKCNES